MWFEIAVRFYSLRDVVIPSLIEYFQENDTLDKYIELNDMLNVMSYLLLLLLSKTNTLKLQQKQPQKDNPCNG